MTRVLSTAVLALVCFIRIAAAADDPLAFHVKDKDFVGVTPPAWVLDGAVKVFLPIEDHKAIDEAAAVGATVLHAGGPWPYYPLLRDDPRSGIPEAEKAKLVAGINHAKSRGMRVILGIMPLAPVPMVKQHPDWMLYPTDDPAIAKKAEADLTRPEHWGDRQLALNSPYGDHLIECLAEMMRDLKIDGFSFDGHYHPAINFSPWEKELYRKETGRAVPKAIDLNSVDYRLYLLWADGKLEAWYRKLHDRLREVNPESAVYTWTTNAGRYGHFLTSPRVMSARMNRLFDCPVQEWWLDEVNLGASVVPLFGAAYVRAVSGGRVGASEPYIMSRGNPYSSESFPPYELTARCLGAMTNGSFTPLSTMAGKEATLETLRQIKLRSPWVVRTEQAPWAAMLVSEQTRQFYAGGQIMERFLSHTLGVFRVAFEEHLPLNLITEPDLRPEILSRYRVLFLPNAACLSDDQMAVIRAFVAGGGGLVATCETSLFDEIGRPRHDFGLGELFGVSYLGRPKAPDTRPALDANFAIVVDEKYWAQRSGVSALRWGAGDLLTGELVDDPRLKSMIVNVQATFKGPSVKISEPKPPMKRAMIMFPDAGALSMPAAAMGEFGKGRVVYLAVGLDAANYSYGYPYQRLLVAKAIRWAAREPFEVQVTAPMCVQATYWRQADAKGRRAIVQLFNGLNTTSDHGLPEVDVPLREEAVPIAGITVRFTGIPVKRFHLEPGGQALEPARDGDALVVAVPPLGVHAILVAELE